MNLSHYLFIQHLICFPCIFFIVESCCKVYFIIARVCMYVRGCLRSDNSTTIKKKFVKMHAILLIPYHTIATLHQTTKLNKLKMKFRAITCASYKISKTISIRSKLIYRNCTKTAVESKLHIALTVGKQNILSNCSIIIEFSLLFVSP